jgi:WS/DGAT/MGAT family acyltransferase
MDAIFLTQEAAYMPMHIGLLMFYTPPASSRGPVRFKDILATFRERAHLSRVFNHKVGNVPFGIDYPFWLHDQDLDVEYHVRHIGLPQPGDWRQLCIQVARLQARILDRERPLWEAYVIEGLDSVEFLPRGSFAILFKLHHAAVDGASALQAIHSLHDARPGSRDKPPLPDQQPPPAPGSLELFRRGTINRLRSPARWLQAARDILPLRERLKEQTSAPSDDERHSTRFNGPISPHRVVEGFFFELDEFRAIKREVGEVTLNDVAVTVVAGAMRKYLQDKGELPTSSLMTLIPVSFRSEEESESGGNLVTGMRLAMHTEIEDPLERLHRIHQASVAAKSYTEAIGGSTTSNFSQLIPPQLASLAILRTVTQVMFSSGASLPINTVITNVAGSQKPLYLCGAELVGCAGLGPIMDGIGLFHAVMSCNGKLSITISACSEMLPDPEFYAQCMRAAYDELRSACTEAR